MHWGFDSNGAEHCYVPFLLSLAALGVAEGTAQVTIKWRSNAAQVQLTASIVPALKRILKYMFEIQ